MSEQRNLPAERRPQLMAGSPVAALVPNSLEEAFRLAGALAASGMAPRGIDKPEQIMVAIMAGAELGLAPFQSLQSFAVVNGKPTLWGDGLMAVVRARGVKVREWAEGEGDQMVAHCVATRPDNGEEIARRFTVAQAKKAGLWGKTGPWTQYPERMLQMRARALALRDGCADMLRGIQVREEVEDYTHVRDVTPPRASGVRERLSGPGEEGFTTANAAPSEPVDFAEHAEEIATAEFEDPNMDPPAPEEPVAHEDDALADEQAEPPASRFDVLAWADDLERKLPLYEDVDLIRSDWDAKKAELRERDPEAFKRVNQAIVRRAAEIGGA